MKTMPLEVLFVCRSAAGVALKMGAQEHFFNFSTAWGVDSTEAGTKNFDFRVGEEFRLYRCLQQSQEV